MKSFETIRQTVVGAFKTLHDANFANVPVNYPNYFSVDFEHLTGAFVSVDIKIPSNAAPLDIGDDEVLVEGEIVISHLKPINTGLLNAATYMDMLNVGLCNKRVSGISYKEMRLYNVSPYPGIVGQQAVIKFLA